MCQEESHKNISEPSKSSTEVVAFTTKSYGDSRNYKPRVSFNTSNASVDSGRVIGNKRVSAYFVIIVRLLVIPRIGVRKSMVI